MAHTIRPVRLSDCLFLYRLRHDPAVVAASFGPPPRWATHLVWFLHRLIDNVNRLWIVEVNGARSGSVRADWWAGAGRWEISVAICPRARGVGLASQAIRMATAYLYYGRITARIKAENDASLRAFLKAGFREVQVGPHVLVCELPR